MDITSFVQKAECAWWIPPQGKMRVPAVVYASKALIGEMDDKVYQQVTNVATLPGIVEAAYAMPDAHWGYGFPIGGVAAFDPEQGGVISAGGVGFDISCGVRSLRTGLTLEQVRPVIGPLAEALFRRVPAGLGSTGHIRLAPDQMDDMLRGGARWAVEHGYGRTADLEFIEERGCMAGAGPGEVSEMAKKRQRDEMGTLGSGNHYLEVQVVERVFDTEAATAFGIREGDVLITIHCGSRGLGHQIGTEFLREMALSARSYGIELPDRELACAPICSEVGQRYLRAMRAGINCALANRQIITHLVREAVAEVLPGIELTLLYDVSHNTCKVEDHVIEGRSRPVYVHRKGATRSFGSGYPDLPVAYRPVGQPVLIGGTMGTASYVLVGTTESMGLAFGSSCHGAGRSMSRHQATKQWSGRELIESLGQQGTIIRSPTHRGVAEEAPGAYKDVDAVADAADQAGLSRKVARLRPLACVKG